MSDTFTSKDVVAAAREAFDTEHPRAILGAVAFEGQTPVDEALVGIPLTMMNRHGLIAGATGTGKTKTLQLLAEQLSAQGVPVFLADLKGDLSGLGAPGKPMRGVLERAAETGTDWVPVGFPIEFLSLTGARGVQVRATISSFGPLLLAKVLGLNETQTSSLSLIFGYAEQQGWPLIDLADMITMLRYLRTDEGAAAISLYGGISASTIGVLLRALLGLERQGAAKFFGEPAFDIQDLMRMSPDGRGVINVLSLSDMQDKPALFSAFMVWMLATLYRSLPELGDIDKPKLAFFFDEAHLIFNGASNALLEQVEGIVRLIRSKGVGVFFVTQAPSDIPPAILAQLGHRVQHALRAFTPQAERAITAAERTMPYSRFYDVGQSIRSMGIGEAMVSVLSANGTPTEPFVTRLVPPRSRMGPLENYEADVLANESDIRGKYKDPVDRISAHEILTTPPEPVQNDSSALEPARRFMPGLEADLMRTATLLQRPTD